MTDKMVLATQQWLNKTYTGRHGYNPIAEDGNTGWHTIYALTRALQIEMGISEPSDNFGNQTRQKYNANPIRKPATVATTSNKFAILQGALWCKGYDTRQHGHLDNHYDGNTAKAVASLEADAGISGDGTYVSADLMKALLSMDQFRILPNSDQHIRTFQQHLNGRYGTYVGIIPCDGIYDRTTNKAAIYMLQALEGMPVSVANGNFGPSTRSKVPTIPYTGHQTDYAGRTYTGAAIAEFTYLLAACLYVNGYGDGNFTKSSYQSETSQFQKSVALSVDGISGLATWLSLLISCGDTGRKGLACDTRFEITQAHLDTLKANGYQYVGRYLTGGDFKELREGELERIIGGGLSVFLIFEEGYKLSYFTASQGKADAKKASEAASKFHIPEGSVIYFAVDFDALNADVTSNILPYFEAVNNTISPYRTGIYGPRNACTRVAKAGYSVSSFVADMSSGFSGNMGYKMPADWAFDQISDITITHNGDSLEIDNDITSGFANVSSVHNLISKPVPHVPIVHQTVNDLKVNDNPRVPHGGNMATMFTAYVNTWNGIIPLYSNSNGEGTTIADINPRESYIARLSGPNVMEAYVSDKKGNLAHGWYKNQNVTGAINDPYEPWHGKQDNFFNRNANGSALVSSAPSINIPVPDGKAYRVFTLRHPASWRYGTTGSLSTIPQGTQVAIPTEPGISGEHFPLYVECDYWRSSAGDTWSSFDSGVGYVEFGFEYGCMPENRLLQ